MKSLALLVILLSSVAYADPVSLSGNWGDAAGRRIFVYHRADSSLSAWVTVSGRYVGFEFGRLGVLLEKDDLTGSAMYEIDASSSDYLIMSKNGGACIVEDLHLNLLGLLYRSGFRGRDMEFRGVGHVTGTLVCGDEKSSWSTSYSGRWRRL